MSRRLQIVILRPGIEAGTGLGSEIAVTVDLRFGILLAQTGDELTQCVTLGLGAGVLRTHVAVEASDIANTDGMGIMLCAMGTAAPQRTTFADSAVEQNEIVVAYAEEAALAVPAVDVGHGMPASFGRGRAMHDDFGDSSHDWGVEELGSRGVKELGRCRVEELAVSIR